MAVTGIMLGLFMLVHAAGNSSIFWGRTKFITYSEKLHSLGPLVHLAELILIAVFLVHIITGFILFLQNNRARSSRYAISKSAGGRTLGSRTMPYSGLLLIAFISIHLFNFHFVNHNRSIIDTVGGVLHNPIYGSIYFIGITALFLHTWHGFWSVFQTLGINHSRYNGTLQTLAWITSSIIVAIFMLILFLLLVNSKYLTS